MNNLHLVPALVARDGSERVRGAAVSAERTSEGGREATGANNNWRSYLMDIRSFFNCDSIASFLSFASTSCLESVVVWDMRGTE